MTITAPDAEGTRRLLACLDPSGARVSLAEHRAVFPAPPHPRSRPATALIESVEQAGLTGRGGAGFPTATKMRAVIGGRRKPIVVVNGSEGEPMSNKDELLMSAAPHLVLDGAALAAAAVGTDEISCAIVLHTGRARHAIRLAVAERKAADPGGPTFTTVDVPARYVAGEERSVVHLLNGGPAIPTASPPRPFEQGVARRPTLVQNVETLAHLALVHRFGPAWFRAVGVPDMPGTALTTVSGSVGAPGVYEIVTGTPIPELLRAAGTPMEPAGAVLVGGYSGTWLTPAQVRSATLDRAGLARVGAIFGPGVVSVLPRDACGLRETAGVMRWMADQTAGQCGPCVFGLAAIAEVTGELARGSARRGLVERVEGLAATVDGRGGCRYPDGAIRLLRSALQVFHEDVRAHLAGAACPPSARGTVLQFPAVPEVA